MYPMMNHDQKHGGGAGGSVNMNHPSNAQQQHRHHDVDKDDVDENGIVDFGRADEDSIIIERDDDDGDAGISHCAGDRISHPDQDDHHNEDQDDEDDEYSGKTYSSFPYPVGDVTCWRSVRTFRDCCCRQNSAWIRHNQMQIVSGITLALAQIPEAVSFSMVVGVNPVLGLQSAWIMGLMTSLTGGWPGMVAGATGAVSVVLTNLVAESLGLDIFFMQSCWLECCRCCLVF